MNLTGAENMVSKRFENLGYNPLDYLYSTAPWGFDFSGNDVSLAKRDKVVGDYWDMVTDINRDVVDQIYPEVTDLDARDDIKDLTDSYIRKGLWFGHMAAQCLLTEEVTYNG